MANIPTIEGAIKAVLEADSEIVAIVGDRIAPLAVPKGTPRPYITFRLLGGPNSQTHDSAVGLYQPRYQIECKANDYETANELSLRVILAIHGFKGTIAGVFLQYSEAFPSPDLFDNKSKITEKVVDAKFIVEGPLTE